MPSQKSNKSNKVFCTCLKCYKKDTESGGLFIPKSTRTRHRKQEKEKPVINSSLSSSSSSLSFSDVYFSSESESLALANSTFVTVDISNTMYVSYEVIISVLIFFNKNTYILKV